MEAKLQAKFDKDLEKRVDAAVEAREKQYKLVLAEKEALHAKKLAEATAAQNEAVEQKGNEWSSYLQTVDAANQETTQGLRN